MPPAFLHPVRISENPMKTVSIVDVDRLFPNI